MTSPPQSYPGLAGRTVVVSGAAQGIGLTIATLLLDQGCRVVLVDRAKDAVEASAERLAATRATPSSVTALAADVTDAEAVEGVFRELAGTHGGIDGLVNNAGIVTRGRLEDFPDDDWDRVIDVNLKGVYLCTKHFARQAIARSNGSAGGAIVNIASMSYKGMTQQIAYASSKGGVVSLTRSAAMELARHGIRVNAVAPGMTETEMVEGLDGLRASMTPAIPLRRFALPEEIAHPVAWLLSDGATYLTGETLHVSGGARL